MSHKTVHLLQQTSQRTS